MKIAIVGPGFMPIPSTGWGAVENLIWDIRCELVKLGHNVHIINTQNRNEIIEQVNRFNPDFVHVQYDDYADCIPYFDCKRVALTSHYGYLTQPHRWDDGYRRIFAACCNSGATIFALSPQIANVYLSAGLPADKVKVVPNGVDVEAFRFSPEAPAAGKTAYVAKVEARKRQNLASKIDRVYYYGRTAPGFENFASHKNYCGEWTRQELHNNLTEHDNLALFSDGEAHALVINEAIAAGLGVVVSELAWSNIDPKLPFVTVVPEMLVGDTDYLSHVIQKNAQLSRSLRDKIRKYSLDWSWSNIIQHNYCSRLNEMMGLA